MAIVKKSSVVPKPDSSGDDLVPEVDKTPAKPIDTGDIKPSRARKTPRPLVEGINAPAATTPEPSFTPAAVQPEPPAVDLTQTMQSQSTVVAPKITLTNSEKQLIEEPAVASFVAPAPAKPKIFPTSSASQKISLPKRSSSARKIGWSLLISLLAVCLVFGALLWYNNKTGGKAGQDFNLFPQRPTTGNDQTPPAAQPDQNPAITAPPAAPVATTTPAATSTIPAVAPVTQVQITNTPTGYLNVRSTPSTSGKQLTQVHPGEIYTYTKTQGGWYYLSLSDGSQGWITGQYAQVVK